MKRPWCWERLKVGGEGHDRGWDVWMASPTQWTWVWVNSESWWWIGRPGMLRSMGLQNRTRLSNWTELPHKTAFISDASHKEGCKPTYFSPQMANNFEDSNNSLSSNSLSLQPNQIHLHLEDDEGQGGWDATAHEVTKSQTWLDGWTTTTFSYKLYFLASQVLQT